MCTLTYNLLIINSALRNAWFRSELVNYSKSLRRQKLYFFSFRRLLVKTYRAIISSLKRNKWIEMIALERWNFISFDVIVKYKYYENNEINFWTERKIKRFLYQKDFHRMFNTFKENMIMISWKQDIIAMEIQKVPRIHPGYVNSLWF